MAGTLREEKRRFHIEDYPADLHKKMTLLQHFRNYLLDNGTGENEIGSAPTFAPATSAMGGPSGVRSGAKLCEDQLVYVQKWLRTRHAVIFRLSNGIVQVNFFDHTKLVLSFEDKMTLFIDKQRQRNVCPLSTASQEQSPELQHRLKYARDILSQLVVDRPAAAAGTK